MRAIAARSAARLVDQPLMRNVLADLALESEAATTLTLRLAGAADRAVRGDAGEQAFRRIATAVGKYWVTKRGPAFTAEALECLGGNGYVEESGMPRHYREAPLLSIWEGSGNVNALDVLRALRREPDTAQALLRRTRPGTGGGRPPGRGRDAAKDAGDRRRPRPVRAAGGADGPDPPGLPPGPARPARGRRRLLRDAARGRLGARLRHAARRGRPGRDPGAGAARRRLRPEAVPSPANPGRLPGPVRAQSPPDSASLSVPWCRLPISWHFAWGGQRVHGDRRGRLGLAAPCVRQCGGRARTAAGARLRGPGRAGRPRSTGCTARCTTGETCTTRHSPAFRFCSRSRRAEGVRGPGRRSSSSSSASGSGGLGAGRRDAGGPARGERPVPRSAVRAARRGLRPAERGTPTRRAPGRRRGARAVPRRTGPRCSPCCGSGSRWSGTTGSCSP